MAIRPAQGGAAGGWARVDFFSIESAENLWLNEINTLAGLPASMVRCVWEQAVVSLVDLDGTVSRRRGRLGFRVW